MKHFILLYIIFSLGLAAMAHNPLRDSVGIESRPNDHELRIYPNPAEHGRVNLEIINDEIKEIRLIDIAGKEVISRKTEFGISKSRLDLHEIPNGIYLIRVTTMKNKIFVKKLIVSTQ
jgi:hypothetical protein